MVARRLRLPSQHTKGFAPVQQESLQDWQLLTALCFLCLQHWSFRDPLPLQVSGSFQGQHRSPALVHGSPTFMLQLEDS